MNHATEDPDKYEYKIDDFNDRDEEYDDDDVEDDDYDDCDMNFDDMNASGFDDGEKSVGKNQIKHLNERFVNLKLMEKDSTKYKPMSKTQLLNVNQHTGNNQQARTSSSKCEMNFVMNPSMNSLQLHSKQEFMKNRYQYLYNQNAKKKTTRYSI
jgi:hypothetical protein